MTGSVRGVRVLVTDGEQRAALAIVRSLGMAGCQVNVASATTPSIAGSSRYARSSLRIPDPLGEPDAFVDVLADIARRDGDVLIPVTEGALLAVLANVHRFPNTTIPFPDHAAFCRASDKVHVAQVAARVGIAVPSEIRIRDREAVHYTSLDGVPYPAVVKPARSVVAHGGSMIRLAPSYVADRASLAGTLAALPESAFPVMVQQRIIGHGAGVFALLWNGQPVATFAHRRIREKPPAGGVSVLRESIAVDRWVQDHAISLLRALDWHGVAMVEFKVEERTGVFYLMEINPRFWGSLQLAIDAGVNFPLLLVQAALGQTPRPVTTYRIGVRSRWWWGDVDHLIARVRRSRRQLNLPATAPGRLSALAQFLASSGPGTRNEVWRATDPCPFLVETLRWLQGRAT